MTTIKMNDFALRHTADSPFSYFDGSFDELCALVSEHFDGRETLFRAGVVSVRVPADRFFTGVVNVTEDTELVASFEARREDEDPAILVRARGEKSPAVVAAIILYRHDVLAEGNENSHEDADWEIVSINARDTEESEPQHPLSMARNQLAAKGGTKTEYSADEMARAIVYWSTRATVATDK